MSNSPSRLTGDARIALNVDYFYRLEPGSAARGLWRVRIVGYFLVLLDADLQEVVAYHWHPEGHSHEADPHMHLGAGAGRLRRELTTAHLTTGNILVTDVLKLALEAFGVRPRRRDWADVLARTRAAIQSP